MPTLADVIDVERPAAVGLSWLPGVVVFMLVGVPGIGLVGRDGLPPIGDIPPGLLGVAIPLPFMPKLVLPLPLPAKGFEIGAALAERDEARLFAGASTKESDELVELLPCEKRPMLRSALPSA